MLLSLAAAGLGAAGCGNAVTGKITARSAGQPAHWTAFAIADRPLDIAGPRRDGSVVLAAGGRLWLLSPSGSRTAFAPGYRSPGGEEPYIALSPGGCYGAGTLYALHLTGGRGVAAVAAHGAPRRFSRLNAPGLIDGIAFDRTGSFRHRLLVTINHGQTTTVDAISCHGAVTTITRAAPRVEGGIAVAPATFGRFAGDLIAPNEQGGRIFAVTPGGRGMLVADSGLPHGGDIGVESEAFVAAGRSSALVSDRRTPGFGAPQRQP